MVIDPGALFVNSANTDDLAGGAGWPGTCPAGIVARGGGQAGQRGAGTGQKKCANEANSFVPLILIPLGLRVNQGQGRGTNEPNFPAWKSCGLTVRDSSSRPRFLGPMVSGLSQPLRSREDWADRAEA